ncbi:MAG: SulP family inorganic anion transporter, partial [Nannocystaceae bacterium]
VARLLTRPVLLGFTAGAALWIASSQVTELLGLTAATGRAPLEVAHALYLAFTDGSFHLPTAGLGLGLLGLAVGLKKWFPRVPRALVLVVLGTVLVTTLGLADFGVSVVGNLPAGLPMWSWPGQALEYAPSLVTAAAVLALLSFSEGYASGLTFARRAGDSPPSPNRELLALGLSNLATGLFSGYPVAGGLSRTAVNAQAGAVTKRAGLWSAVVVGLALLVLTPLFFFLPRAALAAMILMALTGFFDIHAWRNLLRDNRPGAAVFVLTLLATLGFGITGGLAIGIALGQLSRLLPGNNPVQIDSHHPSRA